MPFTVRGAFTIRGKTATTKTIILLLVNKAKTMQGRSALVFDLDGTLIDTAPDLTGALNVTLESLGLPVVDQEEVRNMVGRGARVLIERGLLAADVAPEEALIEQALNTFLTYYGEHIADRSKPFEGVIETLEHFARNGARMGVCTNKPRGLSVKLLEELDLIGYFPVVLGADSVENRKPHPQHLLKTIAELAHGPHQAVMIGDSPADVSAARAAGVPVIVVSFGYSEIAAHDLGADLVIDRFAQLPEAIKRLS